MRPGRSTIFIRKPWSELPKPWRVTWFELTLNILRHPCVTAISTGPAAWGVFTSRWRVQNTAKHWVGLRLFDWSERRSVDHLNAGDITGR